MYRDKHGNPSELPVGLEDAKRHRTRNYFADTACPDCGTSVRYTKSGACDRCARHAAGDLYALAIDFMDFIDIPIEFGGGSSTSYQSTNHLGPVGNRDISYEYKAELIEMRELIATPAPISIGKAQEAGVELWIDSRPCVVAGHYGIRKLNGDCYFCEMKRNIKSPRQIAIQSGQTWYTPNTPCKTCGTLAERNVHNGACRGCKEATKSPAAVMMEAQPDLILSKADASALGITVYRTGEPCNHGHKAYRYVSTGGCLKCLRG